MVIFRFVCVIVLLFAIAGSGVAEPVENWEPAVDTMWGDNAPGTNSSIFQTIWAKVNLHLAGFTEETSDAWDSVYTFYTGGSFDFDTVSRGQFCARMQRMMAVLNDGHSYTTDLTVANTPLGPGVPMLKSLHFGDVSHFGASLTALPDGSALVFDVIPEHPLGLERGDIVLGYDGVAWSELYLQLYAQNIPLSGFPGMHVQYPSHAGARLHTWLASAGMNWHLFDSINVLKHSTELAETYSTSALEGQSTPIWCTEQTPINGIERPDILSGQWVTWGMYPGTDIAYIYHAGMGSGSRSQWEAILDTVLDTETSGIVIDCRFNLGGSLNEFPTFDRLYDTAFDYGDWMDRCDLVNRLDLCPLEPSVYTDSWINWGQTGGDSAESYVRPIAVLIGPIAGSLGDQMPMALSYHPTCKIFGKPTAGMFSADGWGTLFNTIPGWKLEGAKPTLVLNSDPDDPLHDKVFPTDPIFDWVNYEEVWLTPDMVAQGKDDVVEAALAWIDTSDTDDDGVPNADDNCPWVSNADQSDLDDDGSGDFCDDCTDPDSDGYGSPGFPSTTCEIDNCPGTANADQADTDSDGVGDACCCNGIRGNIDSDPADAIDISDLVYLVDYMFSGGSEPGCPNEADVEASGGAPDISDLVHLVDYMFNSGPEPAVCP